MSFIDRVRESAAASFAIMAERLTRENRLRPDGARTGGRTIAGVRVTPDQAMTIAAVWACVRYLSQTTAQLPWNVRQRLPNMESGSIVAVNSPIQSLLHFRPSPEWSSFQFRETLTHWALRWGNGYAEIERSAAGIPVALHPIHPERVKVVRDLDTGELIYEVYNSFTQPPVSVPAMDMFHIRGFGEGPVGVNVINYAGESLGWVKAVQVYGAAFFGNGMNPAGVVINKRKLTEDGLRAQKLEFEQLHKGPTRAHKTAFLDQDADWKKITFNPRESQLTDIQAALVTEVCRWFGVPPHKIMDLSRATFSNIEHQAIEVVVDSVTPWAKRFEDEGDYKLFSARGRRQYFTRIELKGLMRGDMETRSKFYGEMVRMGAYSPNMVLGLEDMTPIGSEGDIHVMQGQMMPLEAIERQKDAPLAPAVPAPTEDGEAGDLDDDDPDANSAIDSFDKLMGETANAVSE